jgi:DNA processing protein
MKDLLPENETEHLLLNQLCGEPVHIDDLCRKSGLLPSIVSSTLTMMELKGIVKHVGSMNYVLAR